MLCHHFSRGLGFNPLVVHVFVAYWCLPSEICNKCASETMHVLLVMLAKGIDINEGLHARAA